DLVMPVFFAAMLIPLWRGPRRGVAWLIAGAVALVVQHSWPAGGSSSPAPLPAASPEDFSMMQADGSFGMLAAILAMAVATYAMRASGFWLMAQVPLTARLRRMLETLPGAVVVSAVLPLIARDGLVAALAIAAAGVVMVL